MSMPILAEPTERELIAMRACAIMPYQDCISWHGFCNSECCSMFSIEDKGQDLSQARIKVFGNAMPDIIRYYQLHGCNYRTPFLYIPTKHCVRHNGRIFVLNRCKALTPEGKCSLHESGKPRVCRELNMENLRAGKVYGGGRVTSRCLFRFLAEQEGLSNGNT